MTYSNRNLVRHKTVKFYVSDPEQEEINRLVERLGGQRQVVIREIVMQAIKRALEAESALQDR